MVLWIALATACGEDAPAPTAAVPAVPSAPPVPVQAQTRVQAVILGTGEVTGAYQLIGDAIAAVVNKKESAYRLHCTVEATGGSLVNLHAVLSGDLQFGLVHSQWTHEAAAGLGHWKDTGAQKELRSVFSLPFDATPAPAAPGASGAAAAQPASGTPMNAAAAVFKGRTTLVTSAKVPEAVVYNFTRAVFENLSKLEALHPAFAGTTPQRMIQDPSAPLHPGAVKYYQEAGWM
jgi:TRAP-type uncharacterized transport system substrate-binding protein